MKKVFTVSALRDLDRKLNKGEISTSRFVEILNEMAHEAYNQTRFFVWLNEDRTVEVSLLQPPMLSGLTKDEAIELIDAQKPKRIIFNNSETESIFNKIQP